MKRFTGSLLLSTVLLATACSGPSAEVLAAERLIEVDLADRLELVLDASCEEPNPPTEISCTAVTADGRTVVVTGTIGADEIGLQTLNVLTSDQLAAAGAAFDAALESAALPSGELRCGDGTVIADADNRFECEFEAESGHTAVVSVLATGLAGADVRFQFDVQMDAAIAAEGTIERSILPSLGFADVRAVCSDAGETGEPFSCGALLDDGRLLEFVAFDEAGTVQVAAANVLAPDELAKLDLAFAEMVAGAGIVIPDGRLDCGSDTVILDTTATFVCSYVAAGQIPIEVTVTAVGLGSADARFEFAFSERT